MSTPTEDEKRELIAKACGWYQPNYCPGTIWMPDPSVEGLGRREVDPFTDLNVMHEAEKTLWEKEAIPEYNMHLFISDTKPTWHATAKQRAEAFGRALKLWEAS